MAPAAKGSENGDTPNRKQKEKYVPQVGDLVFAKVRGHRFWPARVESETPDGRKTPAGKFPVFFFGTYESAVVVAKDMAPFEANKEKHGKGARIKDFATAMREIAESPRITSRPAADPHPGLTSETISLTNQSLQADGHSSDASAGVPAESPVPESAPKKRMRESSGSSAAKKKNKKQKKQKSASSAADSGAAGAVPADPGPQSGADPQRPAAQEKSGGEKSEKSELQRLEKLKAKAVEKEKKKEELKAEKMIRKRQERLTQLKSLPMTVEMLRDVDAEIIESLSVGVRDVSRGLHAMSRLDVLPVTPALLMSYPNIMVTIRKCRKYVHDEQVRKKADYLHHKFKFQFSDTSLDPELLKKMKAIQMKQNSSSSGQNDAQQSSDQAAGHENDCSSQSQSPAESEATLIPTSAANLTAAVPSDVPSASDSLPEPAGKPHAAADTVKEADILIDALPEEDAGVGRETVPAEWKEAAAVVPKDERSETLTEAAERTSAQPLGEDAAGDVCPVVAAVMDNITDAVTAAVPDGPVVSQAVVDNASAASEVVAGDGEAGEQK